MNTVKSQILIMLHLQSSAVGLAKNFNRTCFKVRKEVKVIKFGQELLNQANLLNCIYICRLSRITNKVKQFAGEFGRLNLKIVELWSLPAYNTEKEAQMCLFVTFLIHYDLKYTIFCKSTSTMEIIPSLKTMNALKGVVMNICLTQRFILLSTAYYYFVILRCRSI